MRARSLDVLEEIELDQADPLLAGGFAFGLVVQHEQQHVETMLQTIQLGLGAPGRVAGLITGNLGDVAEAGSFVMGGDDDWAYDNERPAHEAETGAYRIDVEPVSNGDYAAFL